jgi:hypothetical protein
VADLEHHRGEEVRQEPPKRVRSQTPAKGTVIPAELASVFANEEIVGVSRPPTS